MVRILGEVVSHFNQLIVAKKTGNRDDGGDQNGDIQTDTKRSNDSHLNAVTICMNMNIPMCCRFVELITL